VTPGRAERGDGFLVLLVASVAGVAAWFTLSVSAAAAVWSGRWPRMRLDVTAAAVLRLRAHAADPAAAWPPGVIGTPLPPAWLVYAMAALILMLVAAGCAAGRDALRHVGKTKTTGARWATPSDTRALRVSGGARDRLILGRSRGALMRPFVATEARHSVLVLGPTQSGKTSGLAIPAILEWEGPVIATSVKDDLARATISSRSRLGPVRLFDPTASSGMAPLARWSPLSACADWSAAQKMASWLVDATPARAGMSDAAFWYATASKQLAPLLLAAVRGGYTMADIVRWTNTSDLSEPGQTLYVAGEMDASLALSACENRDERIRSSVSTTLETVLAPFEDPEVSLWTSDNDIDLDDTISCTSTLYLCGPSHEQARVQGLFAALVSSAVASATQRVADLARPLRPPLLLVLDEAANIAPVRDLDTIASTGAGMGVQLVTVCQDLSQLTNRYGQDRARTIVNNHRAKLLLSGVSDLSTLDLVSGLAGERAVREHSYTFDQRDGRRTRSTAVAFRRLAPADELRRVPPGEGVLVYGHLAPVKLKLRPWFRDKKLRALVVRPGLHG
jgi:type IV secretion system protein VirD4